MPLKDSANTEVAKSRIDPARLTCRKSACRRLAPKSHSLVTLQMHQQVEQVTSHIVWLKWRLLLQHGFQLQLRACGCQTGFATVQRSARQSTASASLIVFGLSFDQGMGSESLWRLGSNFRDALNELISHILQHHRLQKEPLTLLFNQRSPQQGLNGSRRRLETVVTTSRLNSSSEFGPG